MTTSDVETTLRALETRQKALAAQAEALDSRIEELESAAGIVPPAPVAASGEPLSRVRELLAARESELELLQAELRAKESEVRRLHAELEIPVRPLDAMTPRLELSLPWQSRLVATGADDAIHVFWGDDHPEFRIFTLAHALPPGNPDEPTYWHDQWHALTETPADDGLQLDRRDLMAAGRALALVTATHPGCADAFAWLWQPTGPGWHVVVQSAPERLGTDVAKTLDLLADATLPAAEEAVVPAAAGAAVFVSPKKYRGATAEEPAPANTVAAGDGFTSYIEEVSTGYPVVRFWFHAESSDICYVDYEVLRPPLRPQVVWELISRVFFVGMVDSYYRDTVLWLSLRKLGAPPSRTLLPHPV